MVEGEENRTKERCGLVIRVGLKFGIDIDDEGRANCREETSLRDRVRLSTRILYMTSNARISRWY